MHFTRVSLHACIGECMHGECMHACTDAPYFFRTAGLHGFGQHDANFSQADQNYAIFVINLVTDITTAAMLPTTLRESVGVMNAQAQQVMNSGKNYLYLVGGYGWSSVINPPRNITFPTVRIASVLINATRLRTHVLILDDFSVIKKLLISQTDVAVHMHGRARHIKKHVHV